MTVGRDSPKGLVVYNRGVMRGSSTRRYMPLRGKIIACRQGPQEGRVRSGSAGESKRLTRRILTKHTEALTSGLMLRQDSCIISSPASPGWSMDSTWRSLPAREEETKRGKELPRVRQHRFGPKRQKKTPAAGPAEFNRQNEETTKRTLSAGRVGNSAPAHPSSLKTDRIGGPMELGAGT